MSQFKTGQFEVLAVCINRTSTHLNTTASLQQPNFMVAVSNIVIDAIVTEFCKEFANDNPLFNETMFSSKCGNYVSKTNVNGELE